MAFILDDFDDILSILTNSFLLFVFQANVNGGCLEAGNRGVQGYQLTTSSGSSNSFLPPPIPQGHPNLHHHPQPPMQGVRAYNTNLPSQVGTSSRRISTISSSNSGINPFQDAVEAGPTFLAPVPPTGFRLHQPHRREVMLDLNTRHRNLPHLRLLPEDVKFFWLFILFHLYECRFCHN